MNKKTKNADKLIHSFNGNYFGLTKREYFTAMAMQGFCARPNLTDVTLERIAKESVKQADEVLKELENESE